MSEHNNTAFDDKQTFLIELFFWYLERKESFEVLKDTRIRRANVWNISWMRQHFMKSSFTTVFTTIRPLNCHTHLRTIESHIICSPIWWGVSAVDTFRAPKNCTTDNERTSYVAVVLMSLNIILTHYDAFALFSSNTALSQFCSNVEASWILSADTLVYTCVYLTSVLYASSWSYNLKKRGAAKSMRKECARAVLLGFDGWRSWETSCRKFRLVGASSSTIWQDVECVWDRKAT